MVYHTVDTESLPSRGHRALSLYVGIEDMASQAVAWNRLSAPSPRTHDRDWGISSDVVTPYEMSMNLVVRRSNEFTT